MDEIKSLQRSSRSIGGDGL